MILEQHYLGCLAQASYLVGDQETGLAAVIDPRRDVDLYLERAAALGVEIKYVILTHFHADFVAGHLELAERVGAEIVLGARAQAEYAFRGLADGDELQLGALRLRALETPGHTPEGISLVLLQADEPLAVFTGDTLFVGDVGRPDLFASVGVTAEELASELYDSLHGKLLRLPDETVVYPGHGAGSACGRSLGSERSSTIGEQRAANPSLQPMSKAAFVEFVTAGQSAAPAYFAHDARLNKQSRATLKPAPVRALSVPEALRLVRDGAQVLDVRAAHAFARRHLAGSLHIGLDGNFASWAGSLLDLAQPVVLVGSAEQADEALTRLARVGIDDVRGYVLGEMDALAAADVAIGSWEPLDVEAFQSRRAGTRILDVRSAEEHVQDPLEGSINIPLGELPGRVTELAQDKPLLVVCRTGYRATTAVSVLERAGFRAARSVHGDVFGCPLQRS